MQISKAETYATGYVNGEAIVRERLSVLMMDHGTHVPFQYSFKAWDRIAPIKSGGLGVVAQ